MAHKSRKTTWGDCTPGSNSVEQREWTVGSHSSRPNGRSCLHVSCPFCLKGMTIYIWSLRGGGKRCPNDECGALLVSGGAAYRLMATAE